MPGGIGSGGIVEIPFPPNGPIGYVLGKTGNSDYQFDWIAAGVGAGIGSISGGTTQATGPQVVFSNSPTVTFGVNGNTITASAVGGAGGGVGLSAGTQSVSTGTVVFANSNGITFGMSGSSQVTATVKTDYQSSNANYLTSQSNQAFSAAGGSSAFQTLSFADSNGVSWTNSNGSVVATVKTDYQSSNANYLTSQSNQAVSAANGSYAFQTLSFSNANGVSFGTSAGSAITASYTVPAAQTGISGLVVSNTTYTSGTVSFSNANGISFGSSAGQAITASYTVPTVPAQLSVGNSTGGNTVGDTGVFTGRVVFAGGNNITLSGSSNGASMTISISGPNVGGAQTGISGVIVSNTTYTSGTISFSNANGISFGSSAGQAITASYTVPTQTNQSLGIYNSSQTTGQSSSSTYDARSLSIAFSGNISGGWTNGSMLLTVAPQSVQTQSNVQGIIVSNTTYRTGDVSFSNVNGISFGSSAGNAVTASYTVPSVTQYFSATNTTFNGANISGSITNNTNGLQLSLSVAAPGAAAENNWINLLGANTAGNTTASGSTIGWSGINLTLSGTNGSAVNISAPATSSIVGASGLAISTNGSTISVGQILGSYFDNMNGQWPNSTTMTMFQSTSHVVPFLLPEPISFGFIRIPMTASVAASSTGVTTGNSQFSYGHTRSHNFVLYTRGVGANSQSLQSIGSTQLTDQQSINVSAAANSTQFSYTNRATYQMSSGTVGFTYDYSSSAASLNFHTSGMTAISGLKMMDFSWGSSLTPGQYWLAYGVSSSTASQYTAQGTRLFNVFSNYGASMPALAFGTIGAATNNSVGPFFGLGSFTTAGGSTTNSIPLTAITTTSAHNRMFVQFGRIA